MKRIEKARRNAFISWRLLSCEYSALKEPTGDKPWLYLQAQPEHFRVLICSVINISIQPLLSWARWIDSIKECRGEKKQEGTRDMEMICRHILCRSWSSIMMLMETPKLWEKNFLLLFDQLNANIIQHGYGRRMSGRFLTFFIGATYFRRQKLNTNFFMECVRKRADGRPSILFPS